MATKNKTQSKPRPHSTTRRVSVDGVSVAIDPSVFDDFHVLDLLARLRDEEDPLVFPALFRKILGGQAEAVLSRLGERESGRVPVGAASDFLTGLMEAVAPKHSS